MTKIPREIVDGCFNPQCCSLTTCGHWRILDQSESGTNVLRDWLLT